MAIVFEPDVNIFNSECDVLVNPTNCHGIRITDSGLARQFGDRYKKYAEAYTYECNNRLMIPGGIYAWKNGLGEVRPKYIVSFATMYNGGANSNITFIKKGVKLLNEWIAKTDVGSIAIPQLGCGIGGLDWEDVGKILFAGLRDVSDCCDIHLLGADVLEKKLKAS